MSRRRSASRLDPKVKVLSPVPGGARLRVADMSVPADQRGRPARPTKRKGNRPRAQLDHGNHGTNAKDRPQREREMHRRRGHG